MFTGRFRSHLFAPLPDPDTGGAPAGGGAPAAAPATAPAAPAPPAAPPAGAASPAPPAPPAPPVVPPIFDPENPAVKAHVAAQVKAAEERTRADVLRTEKQRLDEEARLAKLDAEARAREEATVAKGNETKARNEAARANRERDVHRALARNSLVVQDDDCESLIVAAVEKATADANGQPVDIDATVRNLAEKRGYLFRPKAPGTASPTEVVRSGATNAPAAPAAAPAGGVKTKNAYDLSDADWQKELREATGRA